MEADIYTKKIARDIGISENAIKLEILGNNNDSGEKHRFQPRQDREEKTSSAACGRSALTESTVPGSVHSTLFISFYVMMRVYKIIA